MVIQHNISALNAHRFMGLNNQGTSKNLEKLSSGYRINRAADDAAGLAISEKMRGQIRGLAMAEQNTSHGINLIQTAEGGLNETHDILQRMRELAVQSSNGTYQQEDRDQLTKEFDALKSEVTRIADSTHYNNIKLLDGNLATPQESVAGATAAFVNDGSNPLANADIAGSGDIKIEIDASGNVSVSGLGSGLTATGTLDPDTGKVDITLNGGGSNTGKLTLDLANMEAGKAAEINLTGLRTDTVANWTTDIADAAKLSATQEGQGGLVFQIGANGGDDQRVYLSVGDMSAESIGLKEGDLKSDGTIATAAEEAMLSDAKIDNIDNANKSIDIITAATLQVAGQRAELGALQNRLEHTMNNLGVTKENLTAAESTIRDVDMAKEMMEFTKNNILVQASQAMLAQANQLPQGVLQLLR